MKVEKEEEIQKLNELDNLKESIRNERLKENERVLRHLEDKKKKRIKEEMLKWES